jgi:hypothetical protein
MMTLAAVAEADDINPGLKFELVDDVDGHEGYL